MDNCIIVHRPRRAKVKKVNEYGHGSTCLPRESEETLGKSQKRCFRGGEWENSLTRGRGHLSATIPATYSRVTSEWVNYSNNYRLTRPTFPHLQPSLPTPS